jgi:hypothetical protein
LVVHLVVGLRLISAKLLSLSVTRKTATKKISGLHDRQYKALWQPVCFVSYTYLHESVRASDFFSLFVNLKQQADAEYPIKYAPIVNSYPSLPMGCSLSMITSGINVRGEIVGHNGTVDFSETGSIAVDRRTSVAELCLRALGPDG